MAALGPPGCHLWAEAGCWDGQAEGHPSSPLGAPHQHPSHGEGSPPPCPVGALPIHTPDWVRDPHPHWVPPGWHYRGLGGIGQARARCPSQGGGPHPRSRRSAWSHRSRSGHPPATGHCPSLCRALRGGSDTRVRGCPGTRPPPSPPGLRPGALVAHVVSLPSGWSWASRKSPPGSASARCPGLPASPESSLPEREDLHPSAPIGARWCPATPHIMLPYCCVTPSPIPSRPQPCHHAAPPPTHRPAILPPQCHPASVLPCHPHHPATSSLSPVSSSRCGYRRTKGM